MPVVPSRIARFALVALLSATSSVAAMPGQAQPVPTADNPVTDGWLSESYMQEIGRQLKTVLEVVKHPSSDEARQTLRGLAATDFSATALRPADLHEAYTDGSIRVMRPRDTADPPFDERDLEQAVQTLAEPLRAASAVRAKIKDVGIDLSDDRAVSKHLASIVATVAGGTVEIHSSWTVTWARAPEAAPRILRLAVTEYEETWYDGGAETLFAECTESALGRNSSYAEHLLHGPQHWLIGLEAAMGTDIMGHSGIAVGDVNGDGLEDVYLPQHGGLPNRLYVQDTDGTVVDRSAAARVDWLDRSFGALLIDLDNDGDQDLVVGSTAGLLVHSNDGSGRFTLEATVPDARYAYSLAAADYDVDGDLDLYATRYSPIRDDPVDESIDVPKPIPYHDARNGSPNVLLRNEGDWRFSNATVESGLDTDNRRWSFAAAWEDYDDDGDQDLYVANDFGPNGLYRNNAGHFSHVAAEAGVEDIASGMSAAWGDVDRDGRMDLYVGNMFSSAGSRITTQPGFRQDAAAETRRLMQRMAKGNSLFLGSESGTFSEVAEARGASMGRWAWSSLFADLNNDGWEDLIVANGFLTAELADDL